MRGNGFFFLSRKGYLEDDRHTGNARKELPMPEEPSQKPKGLAPSMVTGAVALVGYQPGAVVSREIIKKPSGNVTIFAFDEGEGLTEHSSPFDALVQVIEGSVDVSISGKPYRVAGGEVLLMPANEPHGLKGVTKFKMILTMIK
jgi:quercetin dioxygenase-like cupin family protein